MFASWICNLYLQSSLWYYFHQSFISSGFYCFNPLQKKDYFFSSHLPEFSFWKWHTESLPFSVPPRLVTLSQRRFFFFFNSLMRERKTLNLLITEQSLTNWCRHQRMHQIDSLVHLNQHQHIPLPYFTLNHLPEKKDSHCRSTDVTYMKVPVSESCMWLFFLSPEVFSHKEPFNWNELDHWPSFDLFLLYMK